MIARTLGCSVREAQQRIDAREFAEWRAYYQLEPWGEDRGDLRTAILAWLLAPTLLRGTRTWRVKDFLAKDFLGLLEQEEAAPKVPPPVSAERIRAVLSAWTGNPKDG